MGFSPPSRRSLLCHHFYQTLQTQYYTAWPIPPPSFGHLPPQADGGILLGGASVYVAWRGLEQANISDRDVASDVSAQSSLYPAWWTENVFIVSASAVNYRYEQKNLPKRYQS